MAGENPAEVLELAGALEVGKGQIAHLRHHAAQDAVDGQEVEIDLHLGNQAYDHAVDDGDDHAHHQAADGTLHRLLRRELGGQLALAQKHPHQHSPGIHHEGDENGQEDIAGAQLHRPYPDHRGQAVGDRAGEEEPRPHPVNLHPEVAQKALHEDHHQIDQEHQQAPRMGLAEIDPEGNGQGHRRRIQRDAGVVHADGMEGLIGPHHRQYADERGGKGGRQDIQDQQDHRDAHAGHQNPFFHVTRLQICAGGAENPPRPRPAPQGRSPARAHR